MMDSGSDNSAFGFIFSGGIILFGNPAPHLKPLTSKCPDVNIEVLLEEEENQMK